MKKQRILYFIPLYQNSFFEADALRKSGHHVDIYVPEGYPEKLLWSHEGVVRRASAASGSNGLQRLWMRFLWFRLLCTYNTIYSFGKIVTISHVTGIPINLILFLLKACGVTFVNSPSGCLDEAPKSFWRARDGGSICGNCAFSPNCNEKESVENIDIANKHSIRIAGTSSNPMMYMDHVYHFKARSFDLEIYHPNLVVPLELAWREESKTNIIHSFMSNGRGTQFQNIKGSQFVIDAVDDVRRAGHEMKLLSPSNTKSSEMRYLQVQADIAIDQLIYGWWGSTTLECLALGVPVICYLSDDFLRFFYSRYSDIEIPVINANPATISRVLRELVEDKDRIRQISKSSRIFAEWYLDANSNVHELLNFFNTRK